MVYLVDIAGILCLVYGKFIEVWRQKEAALKYSQLTKLLLANASHEGTFRLIFIMKSR
jgi:hypothetical protein